MISGQLVDPEYTRDWYGLYTGVSQLGVSYRAGPERAVLVLGPPRCGKTSAVVVPCVATAVGAVVSTSTKPDVLHATGRFRSGWGRCFVFDPTGMTPLPDFAIPLRWSPVQGAESFETAVRTSHSLASAARPGASLSEAAHWVERAESLLAPLLHAAALSGRTLADVLGWVLSHQLNEPTEILAARAARMPRIILCGILATEERERSGIFSTAAGLLGAYRSEAALKEACAPNFDPVAFSYSSDTIYVTAPAHAQEQLAPLVVTLLEQIRQAVYARPPDAAPVIFALDEVAQIAPLPSLPAIAAEGGGQGLVTLACLQDLSQARARWGQVADGFFSLFSTTLIFPGIGDRWTLDLVSALAGEHDVRTKAYTEGPLADGLPGLFGRHKRGTWTYGTRREPRLPVDAAARGLPGHALSLDQELGYVRVPPWWELPFLREGLLGPGV